MLASLGGKETRGCLESMRRKSHPRKPPPIPACLIWGASESRHPPGRRREASIRPASPAQLGSHFKRHCPGRVLRERARDQCVPPSCRTFHFPTWSPHPGPNKGSSHFKREVLFQRGGGRAIPTSYHLPSASPAPDTQTPREREFLQHFRPRPVFGTWGRHGSAAQRRGEMASG